MWIELRLFLVALQMLTRCLLPAWVGWRPEWPQHSLRHFPGVGLLVGSGAALVVWAAGHAWPALVSVLLSMAFTLWLTGARHEIGWAQLCERPLPPDHAPPFAFVTLPTNCTLGALVQTNWSAPASATGESVNTMVT